MTLDCGRKREKPEYPEATLPSTRMQTPHRVSKRKTKMQLKTKHVSKCNAPKQNKNVSLINKLQVFSTAILVSSEYGLFKRLQLTCSVQY